MAGGQIKQPRLKFLGRPREVFASAESDSDTQRGRGIIQLGQQGFKEVCQIGKNWDQKSRLYLTRFNIFCLGRKIIFCSGRNWEREKCTV